MDDKDVDGKIFVDVPSLEFHCSVDRTRDNLQSIHRINCNRRIGPKVFSTSSNLPIVATIMSSQSSKNAAVLQDFLGEYIGRLSISSQSNVLCFDEQCHSTLQAWCKDNLSHFQQPTLTLLDRNQAFNSTWPHKESSFSHVFATLSNDLKTSVKGLKFVHYTLVWKGVAVILPSEGGEVAGEKVDLAKLIDLGGFEPGKVRVVERKVKVGEEEVESEIAFAMKWDLLSA